ncbi:hypothetical protein [Thiothrix subterranea]|uniref:hypothetical protein n=1 Tax=Thiothrix subterranea TaxID=2735563 RepID=UPI00280BFECA|nr:hypothetical protein [Thiothrix subterranea]
MFANLHFSELPAALDPIAATAEARLPEEVTYRAGTAAIALHRWGYDAATVVSGYQYSAGLDGGDTHNAETYAAVRLADWVAYLYRDSFDLVRWEILRGELAGMEKFTRLLSTWELCLPEMS